MQKKMKKTKNEKKPPQKHGCLAAICVLVFISVIVSPFTSGKEKDNATKTEVPAISQSSTKTQSAISENDVSGNSGYEKDNLPKTTKTLEINVNNTSKMISTASDNEEHQEQNITQVKDINVEDLDNLQKIYCQVNFNMTHDEIMDVVESSGLPYIDAAYKDIYRTKIAFSQNIARNYPTDEGDYININYGNRHNSDMSINDRTHIEYIEYYNHKNDIYLVMFDFTGGWYNIIDEPRGYFVYYNKTSEYDSVSDKEEQFQKLFQQ